MLDLKMDRIMSIHKRESPMYRLKVNIKNVLKRITGLFLICAMLLPQSAYAQGINDIADSSDYAKQAIVSLFERNIIEGDLQGNEEYYHIRGYKDFYKISDWAKEYVNQSVERQLMYGTDNLSFSPGDFATMEQSAVVIDRLIGYMDSAGKSNGNPSAGGLTMTLNGDRINMAAVSGENGSILVPADFMKYFNGDYQYDAARGLFFATIMPVTPAYYIESWAKPGSKEAYVFVKKSVNDIPFNNPDEYVQNRVEYSVPPQLVGSTLYLPADFVVDATGIDYKLDAGKNTLSWTDNTGTDYPTLLAALKNKVYQNKQEMKYSLNADFKDKLGGNRMHYAFKTEGQFDMSDDLKYSNYHVINDKSVTTDITNGSDLDRQEKSETVKIGSDMYRKNEKTGQYELIDSFAEDIGSPEYGFVKRMNSQLYNFFTRNRIFDVYDNVKLDGQSTTKYVLRLTDINDIAYVFGSSNSVTVEAGKVIYEKFHPAPLARYYYDIEAFFLGHHWDRTIENDYTGYPLYSDCSAKIEIYVSAQDEIIKEIFYNSGSRYDYMVPSGGSERTDRVYRDIDYDYVYEVMFKPFSGSIKTVLN